MKVTPEEIYVPEEQAIYHDAEITKKIATMKLIQKHLVRRFVVSDLDRDSWANDFLKIDCAHAVGVLEGRGSYSGIHGLDETWIYEYKDDNGRKQGGVAVVNDKIVVDYYHIWESIDGF